VRIDYSHAFSKAELLFVRRTLIERADIMQSRIEKLITVICILAALASASSAQAQWTLNASPSSTSSGNTATVTWSAPSGSPTTDWIGLYKVGGAALYNWIYTNGTNSGNAAFTMPENGSFEFRYYLNGGNTQVAASNTVAVSSASFTVDVSPESAVHG